MASRYSTGLVQTALRLQTGAVARVVSGSRIRTALPVRRLSTSTASRLPSDDPGGKPNTGQHRTVYDDFFNILEPNIDSAVSVASTSPSSFTLQDGLVLEESVILLNNQVFLWDHPKLDQNYAIPSGIGWEDWLDQKVSPKTKLQVSQKVKDTFQIFELVDQRPEILLFGTGKTVLPPPQPIRSYINSLGIQLDVQNTHDAASTFNMLSEEGRKVAAILIPSEPKPKRRYTPQQLQDLLSGK
ncbi:hypothetical protein BCV70DRAFT_214285 [Testicularia cyperi]|uniref:NADH dehydrogenase [ubiquinone] 1 alpha subcomplex assembly factor 3 n=1 Tax=Testicularia cyperi TaxID=1882483 RepID=A0A317XYB6_9BASI|nr:hypothetical protein BCV70DRAFT_214285 [Testicularia cyperi]